MSKLRIKTKRPWIGYPGSTLQQNYAEQLSHGYLLWEISGKDSFDVKFCELPNPRPFVTVEWRGSVEETVAQARAHPEGARFRVRTIDVLAQKEVAKLTSALRQELKASEVTFKNDQLVDHDAISAGAVTLARDDLRNPDVLLRLLKDYHKHSSVSECEWDAVREQLAACLHDAVSSDDLVRNTKWSLLRLSFDNTFTYGSGNVIDFDKLRGIVGIFGPNRVGKSSIVGTIMYALFNTTDRGSVKNLHVVNVRHPYCYTKAVISVNGTCYVIERQTAKHETKRGQVNAGTALNVFKIDESGEAVDLAGEQRNDTEKVIRQLIGSAEDCLMTSVAAQDDIKQFINQGTSKRRRDLSRFLDLDIFDRMYETAKNDVNANKAALKSFPDRDFAALEAQYAQRTKQNEEAVKSIEHQLHDASHRLHDVRSKLAAFKDFKPITPSDVERQQSWVKDMSAALEREEAALASRCAKLDTDRASVVSVEEELRANDVSEMKRQLEAQRSLEASLEALRRDHEREALLLKSQERSLKILDDVPCGDAFPSCRFIKDAHKVKDKVEPQRERAARLAEKLEAAEAAARAVRVEGLAARVSELDQKQRDLGPLHRDVEREAGSIALKRQHLDGVTIPKLREAERRLSDLREALKNDENEEAVALRNSLDELQRSVKKLDAEKLALASEAGRIQSDCSKLESDKRQRADLLHVMKAHELIAQAFSRRGIPKSIVASQLPLINAEVAKILNGIVDFTIELEQDDDSDSMEVYIDYGDSRRVIELCSGMEKTIASIAIRVALVNVSSLPKTDMFIIDESFGPLDPSSVEACNRLLVSLKKHFKCLIVISHVDGIKDVADHIIEVNKVEKDARVTCE